MHKAKAHFLKTKVMMEDEIVTGKTKNCRDGLAVTGGGSRGRSWLLDSSVRFCPELETAFLMPCLKLKSGPGSTPLLDGSYLSFAYLPGNGLIREIYSQYSSAWRDADFRIAVRTEIVRSTLGENSP